jgi:hypothetical protein
MEARRAPSEVMTACLNSLIKSRGRGSSQNELEELDRGGDGGAAMPVASVGGGDACGARRIAVGRSDGPAGDAIDPTSESVQAAARSGVTRSQARASVVWHICRSSSGTRGFRRFILLPSRFVAGGGKSGVDSLGGLRIIPANIQKALTRTSTRCTTAQRAGAWCEACPRRQRRMDLRAAR